MRQSYLDDLKEKINKEYLPGRIEALMVHNTLYARFKEITDEQPNAIALNYFGNKLTYKEALDEIDSLAKGLVEWAGIKDKETVAVSLLASPSAVICLYALDKIGAFMHMVNCSAGTNEVEREINNVRSRVFIGNDLFCSESSIASFHRCGIEKIIAVSTTDYLPKTINSYTIKYYLIEKFKGLPKKAYSKDIIAYKELLKMGKQLPIIVEPVKYERDRDVTIAYTSGSTGQSKAVVATWDGIDSMVQVMGMTEEGRFVRQDIMLSTLPLWIYFSLLNMIHELLLLGVTLAFDPLFDAKSVYKLNNIYRFNHWLTATAYLDAAISKNKKTDTSGWKIVLTGGSALDPKLQNASFPILIRFLGRITSFKSTQL